MHTNVEQVQTLPRETEAVAAGFPCQDLSPESSTRKGLKGSKTSMVRHVFRLLKASPPVQWLVLENVPGKWWMTSFSGCVQRLLGVEKE
jgi:DNA (cytosine-5)-methyltransferase 1